jgi:nucleoid-associated protein EbfC
MTTPDLKQIMEQAKKMQEEMRHAQEELAKTEVTGESGGGLVKITITCEYETRKIVIAEETWKEDKEIIEGLIIAAFNNAVSKVKDTSRNKISALTKSMGLPDNLG